MNTPIPASRVPFIDERSGQISREWYLFLLQVKSGVSLVTDTSFNVKDISENYSPDNSSLYLICYGDVTINLESVETRTTILSITNAGGGVVTVLPVAGETINGDSSKELEFRWTSIQLCPTSGGYVIL